MVITFSQSSIRTLIIRLFVIFSFAVPSLLLAASTLSPVALRCEYLENPLGIDELHPRLTWRVESNERAQKQTAYQILVATDENALKADRGDLWDSARMDSEETVNVAYKGKPLA